MRKSSAIVGVAIGLVGLGAWGATGQSADSDRGGDTLIVDNSSEPPENELIVAEDEWADLTGRAERLQCEGIIQTYEGLLSLPDPTQPGAVLELAPGSARTPDEAANEYMRSYPNAEEDALADRVVTRSGVHVQEGPSISLAIVQFSPGYWTVQNAAVCLDVAVRWAGA